MVAPTLPCPVLCATSWPNASPGEPTLPQKLPIALPTVPSHPQPPSRTTSPNASQGELGSVSLFIYTGKILLRGPQETATTLPARASICAPQCRSPSPLLLGEAALPASCSFFPSPTIGRDHRQLNTHWNDSRQWTFRFIPIHCGDYGFYQLRQGWTLIPFHPGK